MKPDEAFAMRAMFFLGMTIGIVAGLILAAV
jgi:hypothetical protein